MGTGTGSGAADYGWYFSAAPCDEWGSSTFRRYLIDGGEEDDHRSMSGMVSHYKQYRNVSNGDPEHLGSVKLVPLGDTLGGGVSLISHHLPCGLIMAYPQTDNVRKGGWVWGGVEGGGYQLSPWLVAWSLSTGGMKKINQCS